MAVDPQSSKPAVELPEPSPPKSLTVTGYALIGVAVVVVVALIAVVVQHRSSDGEVNGPVTYAVGDGSTSTIGGRSVAPPSGAFVRYADPSHRQRKFGEGGEGSLRGSASGSSDDSDNARAAQAAKAERDAAAAAAKADSATAAAGAAAAKQAAQSSSQSAGSGQAPFNPVGRWVRQDGANDYQFFRSDGIWYESDGTESTAAADTFPDAAHWQMDTEGDTTYVTTGADRFTVVGQDTIRGEKSGTFIRVGE